MKYLIGIGTTLFMLLTVILHIVAILGAITFDVLALALLFNKNMIPITANDLSMQDAMGAGIIVGTSAVLLTWVAIDGIKVWIEIISDIRTELKKPEAERGWNKLDHGK